MVITASSEHLGAIGRLRYAVFVEEMGRNEPDADHAARVLLDHGDHCSTVLAAFCADGNALGTVRWQAPEQLSAFDYDFHFFDRLPNDLRMRSSLTSKLMIASTHRKGSLATRLVVGVFESGYLHNRRLNIINCNPPLDRFFAKLGFVQIAAEQQHPIYGAVSIMLLPMADLPFFRSIRSPFASVLERLEPDPDAAQAVRDWCISMGVRYWV